MPKKTHFLRKKYLDFLIELIFIFAPTKKESTYMGTRQDSAAGQRSRKLKEIDRVSKNNNT